MPNVKVDRGPPDAEQLAEQQLRSSAESDWCDSSQNANEDGWIPKLLSMAESKRPWPPKKSHQSEMMVFSFMSEPHNGPWPPPAQTAFGPCRPQSCVAGGRTEVKRRRLFLEVGEVITSQLNQLTSHKLRFGQIESTHNSQVILSPGFLKAQRSSLACMPSSVSVQHRS